LEWEPRLLKLETKDFINESLWIFNYLLDVFLIVLCIYLKLIFWEIIMTRFDLLLKNGQIVNGTGNPWFYGDVGIKNGKILKIGKLKTSDAERVLDTDGLAVCPGFIDAHSHSDMVIPFNPNLNSAIHQGVTTLITGQCGYSLAPVTPTHRELLINSLSPFTPHNTSLDICWLTFEEYLHWEALQQPAANIGHLLGHGTLRIAVLGVEDRDPSSVELDKMKQLIVEAMNAGALGMSTGLIYPPGVYTKTPELVELAKIVANYGGIYASHIRGEGHTLINAVKEAVTIGETAHIAIEISHHKASGRSYWGQTSSTLQIIDDARNRGIDVTYDQYPYTAGMTSLVTLLPPWVHEGGLRALLKRLTSSKLRKKIREDMKRGLPGWENIGVTNGWENIRVSSVKTEANRALQGKTLKEITGEREPSDVFTVLFDLILEEEGEATMIIFSMCEDDVRRVLVHPAQMVGSDSWSTTPNGIMGSWKPHPRFYGTYPRILGRYVREEKILTFEDAIRRMTAFPAQRYGLHNRGMLREGAWADIVVLDADNVIDKADYDDPHRYPLGTQYVLVNGEIVIEERKNTGARVGQVISTQSS
jgi:N-acyl-D-aspartate/D-glutamate deacylase